jgi:hypothetical protein
MSFSVRINFMALFRAPAGMQPINNRVFKSKKTLNEK